MVPEVYPGQGRRPLTPRGSIATFEASTAEGLTMARSFPLVVVALAASLLTGCPDQTVTAVNATPEVTITSHADGDVLLQGATVTFTGIASDPDHPAEDLLATWRLGGEEVCPDAAMSTDGLSSCQATVDLDDTSLVLEVVDPQGAAGAAVLTLEITPTDAPVVSITAPEPSGVFYSDQLISFEGTVSDAEDDADQLEVWWESSLVEGELGVSADPTSGGEVMGTGYLDEGEHAISLHALDSTDKTGSDSVVITVGPPNGVPSCAITAPESGGAGDEGALVTFEAEVGDDDVPADWLEVVWSSDKDGEIGQSTPNTDGSVTFPYAGLSVNTHVVSLMVNDEVGATCTASVLYTVGTPPTVSLSAPTSGEIHNEGDAITFTAEVSDNEDSATALALSWTSDLDGEFSTQGADSTGLAQFTNAGLSAGDHTLTLTVTDTAGLYATALVTTTVNGLPSAPTLTLGPDPATTDDDLIASASGSTDPDGSGTVTYAYAWYESGVLSAASSAASFPSSATTKGLSYRVVVTPSDGIGDGATAEAEITVDNSPPVLSTPTISPSPTVSSSDTLTCSSTATDADGDTPTVSYAWSSTSGSLGSGSSLTLSSSTVATGDVVTCTVTATDDEGSTATASASVTVTNGVPSISSVTISPDPAYSTDTLTCAYSGYSDADGDADASTIAWTVGGVAAGSGATISGTISRGDTVTCTVTPYDGIDSGTPVADSLVVSNTPPVLDEVTLAPEPAYEGDTLICTPGSYADDDGDSATFSYVWDVAGVDPGVTTATLSSTWFDRDESVVCGVTPNDGSDDGAMVASNRVTISNTAPSITGVAISPASPTSGDTLTCAASGYSDADGDPDVSTTAWTVNGADAGSSASPSITIAGGDTVVCTVTPDDGSDTGTPMSDTVTVANQPPEVDSVVLSPSAPDTDDTVTATVTTHDDDGDTVTVSYAWYVDGGLVSATGSSLDGVSWFDKHQDVYVVVTPSDGVDGTPVSSSSVTVVNTPPEAATIYIDPSSPSAGVDDLRCVVDVDSYDADGDSVAYAMSWTVDGVAYFAGGADTADTAGWLGPDTDTWTDDTVPAEDTLDGETWVCTVTPDDGDDPGATAQASVTTASGTWSGVIEMPATDTVDGFSHGEWSTLNGDGRVASRIVLTQGCANPILAFYQHSSADTSIHGSYYVMDSSGTVLDASTFDYYSGCNDCWLPHSTRLSVTMSAGVTYYLGFQNGTGLGDMSGPSIYLDASSRTVGIATFDDPRADQPGADIRGLATTSVGWQNRWSVDCE
jgi:hypothetical protein